MRIKVSRKNMKRMASIIMAGTSVALVTQVVQAKSYSEFIIPHSSEELLDSSDIAGFSIKELNYARNEIFARHGYKFQSQELMEYFGARSWYSGVYPMERFDDSCLSLTEKKNVDFLKSEEIKRSDDGYKLDQNGYLTTDIDVYFKKLNRIDYSESSFWDSNAVEGYRSFVEENLISLGEPHNETLYADWYYLFDMNNDGTPELLAYTQDDWHCYHWYLYSYRQGDVQLLAKSEDDTMGNASFELAVINDSVLVDHSDKYLVGYDTNIDRYYYMDEKGDIHILRQEISHINDFSDDKYSSTLSMSYSYDGNAISEEQFNRYFDFINYGDQYSLDENSDNLWNDSVVSDDGWLDEDFSQDEDWYGREDVVEEIEVSGYLGCTVEEIMEDFPDVYAMGEEGIGLFGKGICFDVKLTGKEDLSEEVIDCIRISGEDTCYTIHGLKPGVAPNDPYKDADCLLTPASSTCGCECGGFGLFLG